MKNSIRNEILFLNISSTLLILTIIFIISIFTFQKNIINNTIKNLTEYSQESQIYFLKIFNNEKYENAFVHLNNIAPFVSEYFSNKYNAHVEIYDIRKNLLADTSPNEKFYVYQDIHYAANNMKNYIIKKTDDKYILFFSSPIFYNNETIGVLRFIYPLTEEFQIINKVKMTLFIVDIVFILFIIFINYILANSITTPLIKLKKETEEIAKGNFDFQINIVSNEDINSLVNSFNIMKDKLIHYIKSLKEEKEKQKNFIDNMTHEFKTPITSILGHAELLKKLKYDEDKNVSINYIISEGNRLLKMVEELLYVSKLNKNSFEFNFKNADIKSLVIDSINTLKPRFKKFSINVRNEIDSETLFFDYERIKEVILNILDNAIKHGKCENIFIYSKSDYMNYYLIIENDGVPIEPNVLKNIFTPLTSNKKGKNGLGLCISKEIMQKHKGDLLVNTDKRVKFILKFKRGYKDG
ncbi:HAMP domain-containing sensor histidine kinase [Marinitoga lauensis]|uniref:HAMP domain-containing sensor histidine kinase n=1 Tax=Marinitoga lauensis TaxID=2201189 RepID=UPI0010103AE9|nr:HAMP domain-containing sensor histidine kinase [Marinitoga lauensis]